MRFIGKEIRGQFVRYAMLGGVNTALDFGLYTLLTRTSEFWRYHFLLANAVTFIIVVTWSFFWNKHWTFKNREARHAEQYVKFVIATVCSIAIAEGILYTGVQVFGLHDMVSKLLVVPFTVMWNFLTYRLWAFRSPRGADPILVSEQASTVTSPHETP